MNDVRSEIAVRAARLVVEEGMDYGGAKRRAARDFGGSERTMLPDNQEMEGAVRQHLELFHAETQPAVLLALRRLALKWMERLTEFRPHLTGAVWQGTASEKSEVQLDLYCDDPKLAEISIINLGLKGRAVADQGWKDAAVTVTFIDRCCVLKKDVDMLLSINDYDELRGALRADRHGKVRRGDLNQMRRLLKVDGHG